MEREDRADFVSGAEPRTSADADPTLASPSFDENSVQHARPAVPLRNTSPPARAARTSSPLKLGALALAAGVVGGLVGIFAINLYQRRAVQTQPAATTNARDSQTASRANATDGDARVAEQPARAEGATPGAGASTASPAGSSASSSGAAQSSPAGASSSAARSDQVSEGDESAKGEQVAARAGDAQELRAALSEWIAATNARDVERQMKFYEPQLAAYYLARRASRDAVRAEKERVFAHATSVDVRADDPQISVSADGQTAAMRFRKQYSIAGGGADRSGAVIQELRWRRTPGGWKITSERDLKVVN